MKKKPIEYKNGSFILTDKDVEIVFTNWVDLIEYLTKMFRAEVKEIEDKIKNEK